MKHITRSVVALIVLNSCFLCPIWARAETGFGATTSSKGASPSSNVASASSTNSKAITSVSPAKGVSPVPLELRLLTSETCGLVEFVETVSNRPHKTDWLRDWYFEQAGDQAKLDKEICVRYSKFLNESGSKYEAQDVSGRRMSLSQRIACMAVDCETLDDLLKKLRPILAVKDFELVKITYENFQSFYRSRVWEPRYVGLKAQLEEFRLGAKNCKMVQKLEQVQAFMQTKWLPKTTLDIVLIPLPDAKKESCHGDSIGKTQIVELRVNDTFDKGADVIFHELCHALWGRKKNLAQVYREFQRFNGAAACAYLDEGLATALGQGWFRKSSFPTASLIDEWYHDEVIEAYSRGLYPIVDEYLSEGRCFDTEFVQRACTVFAEKCGFASRVIKNCTVISASSETYAEDHSALEASIFEAMPRLRNLGWTPLAKEDFAASKQSPYGEVRRIVLLSPETIVHLNKQGLTDEQVELLKQREGDVICLALGENEIVFCFGKDPEAQRLALRDLLKKGQWPAPANAQ